MITVTENAVKQLHSLLSAPDASERGDGLRLRVAKGGCAGMEYQMTLDHEAEKDHVIEESSVRLYVDPESMEFLSGCEVDYSDDLTDSGFKLQNPNAARSCGCGTSFAPKEAAE